MNSSLPQGQTSNPFDVNNDATSHYAWDIANDKVLGVGLFEKLACKRHLDDLIRGPARGLTWRPDMALRVIRFFPSVLRVTAGTAQNNPFHLISFTVFVVGSLFGWYRGNRRRFRLAWIETGKGQIKALAIDTPIPTPNGWNLMGMLREGDTVFDENGIPCQVIQAHEIRSDSNCYLVKFDDGSEIIADQGHLWKTEMRKTGSEDHGFGTRGVTLSERGNWRNGIRTTKFISETVRYKNGEYQSVNHSVSLTNALELPEIELPIPPYTLGCWLGDGDSDGLRITIGDQDIELINHLENDGIKVGDKHREGRYQLSWPSDYRGMQSDSLAGEFRHLQLINDKHIPKVYLRASRQQRLELLQGLMDTDGTIANGQCAISSKWLWLARGICELVVSLGIKSVVNSRRAILNGEDCGPAHWVTFYPPEEISVFKLKRKVDRQFKRHNRRSLSRDRRIVSCERIESVPVRCITVNSNSGMFLAGRGMIPTHNSPLAAAIGLYLLKFDGVMRAECYAIAKDRNQANVLFDDAVAMAHADIADSDTIGDSLVSRGLLLPRGTGKMTWALEAQDENGGFCQFRPLAGDEKVSGPRPIFVAADEIHDWKTAGPIEIWQAAGAKMPGNFLLWMSTNTPGVDQMVGSEYSELFQKILRRELEDDSVFAFIARVDENDDPLNDRSVWRKALPCLGITFPIENIEMQVQSAKNSIGTRLNVLRLYFGVPVGSSEYWIDADVWQSALGKVDEEELQDFDCYLSMDLSQKNDLTALGSMWNIPISEIKRFGNVMRIATVRYWKPADNLAEASAEDRVDYRRWAEEGLLNLIPGRSIDYDFVANEVEKMCAKFKVKHMVFDPAHIEEFIKACERIGFNVWVWEPDKMPGLGLKMIIHSQGKEGMHSKKSLWMPRSLGKLEDSILNQNIRIQDNQITSWCSGNAAIRADEKDNRYFVKKHSRGRIDGLVVLAMGTGASDVDAATPTVPDLDDFLRNAVVV